VRESGVLKSALTTAGLASLYLVLRGAGEGAFWGAVAGADAGKGAWIGAAVGAGLGTLVGVAVGVKDAPPSWSPLNPPAVTGKVTSCCDLSCHATRL
jgi:hypothetical protein